MFGFEYAVHVGRLSPWNALKNLAESAETRHALRGLARSGLVGILGLAGVLWTLCGAPGACRGRRRLATAASAWLVGQALFFSSLPYQPFRYFLSLSIPCAALTAVLLSSLGPLLSWARTTHVRSVMLIAGLSYMMSGDDMKKRDSAKQRVGYIIVGLMLVWATPFIVNFLSA